MGKMGKNKSNYLFGGISTILVLVLILMISNITNTIVTSANEKTFKGKILLYHSHTCEDYVDGTIVDAGNDLSTKLEKKGYLVDHITDDFSYDYDNSYYASREMLLTKDLNEYDLIIDLHRDATSKKIIGKDKKGQNVAKVMFVMTNYSPNYEDQSYIIDSVSTYNKQFGEDIVRDTWYYDYGINYYNGDLSENFVLIENGFNTNNMLEIKRANTYLAASISNYLDNNK